jgi:hypothetical protein
MAKKAANSVVVSASLTEAERYKQLVAHGRKVRQERPIRTLSPEQQSRLQSEAMDRSAL